MTSVFISSTGKDLADYREAAIETCNRLGLVPIAMEFFEAMGAGATDGSKRRLEKADLFIGILAHRYGYIEQGHNKAVTEIEFDYAGERGLDRLCFLVKPDYPWPPNLIDYPKIELLQAFKDRVGASLIRSEFTTVDDFKAKLIQALTEWLADHDIAATAPSDPLPPSPPASVPPPRPALIIGREDAIHELKTRSGLVAGSEKRRLTIVRGWPGVGKTTLVTTLAYEDEVQDSFSDGILWAILGEQANAFSELAMWARRLGVPDVALAPSLEEIMGRLRGVLQRRRMLLIVDDVWTAEDAIPFKQIAGPDCFVLITTRFADVARELADVPADIYRLEILEEGKALELLGLVSPTVVQRYSTESLVLVKDLEGLPLAILVAGRLLQAEAALDGEILKLMGELRESHRILDERAPDDRFDPQTGTTPTVDLLLKRSTDWLDRDTRDCFAMLGAFAPKPATFDQEAMKFVWEVDDPMPTIRKLVDRGLLEPIPTAGRFQLHALLVLHAKSLLEE
jgi:hypothetical protein